MISEGATMIIVAGYVHVDSVDRDRYVEAFTDLVNLSLIHI